MSELSAYKGDLPYIFVSYAHKDSQQVFPLLVALQEAGFRIWFDHGIEAGTEWSNNIAEHLGGCSAFLFFTSSNSVKSENCLDEVAYAKSHNKPALLAYLEEDVVLPSGTDMQTARFQRMYVNRQPSLEAFVENFSAAEIFNNCRGEAAAVPKGAMPSKPVSKEKKPVSKGLLGGIIAALLVVAIVLVVVLLPKSGDGDNTDPAVSQPSASTPAAPEKVELSDSINDHTLRLDGVVYKLPISYAQLTADGWAVYTSGVNSDLYISALNEVSVSFVKEGRKILTKVYNDGENAKKLKDCHIGYIEVEMGAGLDFCVAAGAAPSATPEDIVELLGTPTERNESSSGITMRWAINASAEVVARCYNGDMANYSIISICNYVVSTEKFETKTEAPAYLDDYTAPETLGDDILSGILSVEGELYQLPVPMREFLNSGWEIASGAAALVSGQSADMTIKKGESTLQIRVSNLSLYKTTPENCLVVRVSAETKNNVQIQLPGGFTLGMSDAEVASRVPADMNVYDGSYSTTYSKSDSKDRDYRISLQVEKSTQTLTTIDVADYRQELMA